jgi:hypothetical protein
MATQTHCRPRYLLNTLNLVLTAALRLSDLMMALAAAAAAAAVGTI